MWAWAIDGAAALQPLDRAPDRAVRRAPAEHEQVALGRPIDLERRDVRGDAGDLGLAQQLHPVVVVRVVAHVAEDVGLLEAADPMLETGRARAPPTGGRASSRHAGTDRSPRARCGSGRRSTAGRRHSGSATARRRWRGTRRTGRRPGSCTSARCATPRSRAGSTRRASPARRPATGESELRPNRTWSRSACSVFVGMPVDGPARWTSTTTSGSSTMTASPSASLLRAMPGPDEAVRPIAPP